MSNDLRIYITETPRDAMQGWGTIIPADKKIAYIQSLLAVGFDTVDAGSFVSARAVPQMADTSGVISALSKAQVTSRIMVIAGNLKGAEHAILHPKVDMVGYPYSPSPTFLKRNINSDPQSAWNELLKIKALLDGHGKEVRAYLSMAFGNPYQDPWNPEMVVNLVRQLESSGFNDIVLSDITGEGSPEVIGKLCRVISDQFPGIKTGLHLHSNPGDWEPKIEAALEAGIRYFEGALGGYGGCPMTGYELLGNLDTMKLVQWCESQGIKTGLDLDRLLEAQHIALKIFSE